MQKVQLRAEKEIQIEYPRFVDGRQFRILKRLMARIDRSTIDTNLFLSYCRFHKKYYLDHSHTNGEIRCPTCDENWLIEHKFRNAS